MRFTMLGQYYIITTMRCVLCGGRLNADTNGPILPAKPLKIPLISDEAINIGKSWLFEEELTELFHERPQAILPHGRDELIMQAALAEQRMDTSLGCAGL